VNKYEEILDNIKKSAHYQTNGEYVQEDWHRQKRRLDVIVTIAENYLASPCAGGQFMFDLSDEMIALNLGPASKEEEDFFWNEALEDTDDCSGCGWTHRCEELNQDGMCEECESYEYEED
jgi:hypothetical protein